MASQILFESVNLKIRYKESPNKELIVVSFASYDKNQTKDKSGFGERLFEKYNTSAIFVTCSNNDWYQYEEIFDAITAINKVTCAYHEIVNYGSSMGGYASILFSKLTKADRVIAISPQFSINPESAPYEKQWSHIGSKLHYVLDPATKGASGSITIIFDPRTIDGIHAERINNEYAVHMVPFAYSGHPSSFTLLETGVLRDLIVDLIGGETDIIRHLKRYKQNRLGSWRYLYALGKSGVTLDRKIYFLRLASVRAPDNLNVQLALGETLLKAGHYVQSAEAFGKACNVTSEFAWPYYRKAIAFMKDRRLLDAHRAIMKAIEISPQQSSYLWIAGEVSRDLGLPEAASYLERSLELDPSSSFRWYNLSLYYKKCGDLDKAEQAARKSRKNVTNTDRNGISARVD
ncbi:tetratricopeptide repeat protein [Methylobacterium tarhaniae]|uniref:tetratricopeptide repeat protein n=1 Tax=Methylobacterium tarhaniae TaxID=1187852 RepID=UPI003CFCD318